MPESLFQKLKKKVIKVQIKSFEDQSHLRPSLQDLQPDKNVTCQLFKSLVAASDYTRVRYCGGWL